LSPGPQKLGDVSRKLNRKQEMFAREYLVDLNARQAAIRAGYSPDSAEVNGPRLLRNAQVAAEVARLQAERAKRVGLQADEVLAELKRVALVDPGALFAKDGSPRPIHELPEDIRRAVASTEVFLAAPEERQLDDGTFELKPPPAKTVKLKLWDKVKALELSLRHLGLLRDKVEHAGAGGGPIQVAISINRTVQGGSDS
jgi:phage terminase small subunit